jgi:hypothetical protein
MHFCTLVISKDGQETSVDRLLAPYDESLEVEAYLEECWCLNREATDQSRAEIDEATRELAAKNRQLSEQCNKNPVQGKALVAERQRVNRDIHTLRQRIIRQHPQYGRPDDRCDDCRGSGKIETTYNPNGRWDWWQVGGRFTGMLSPGYDPTKDPNNRAPCDRCKGDADCRYCKGTKTIAMWPTQWKQYSGDTMPVKDLLQDWKPEYLPYSCVTPDGTWHTDSISESELKALLSANEDCFATVVDCHS